MDRNNRPQGREKNVSSQSGSVHKRGDGVNTGGPVGNSSGYSDRKASSGNKGSGNRSTGTRGSSSNMNLLISLATFVFGGLTSKDKGRKTLSIIILVVVVIGGFIFLKNSGSLSSLGVPGETTSVGTTSGTSSSGTVNNSTSLGGSNSASGTVSGASVTGVTVEGAREKRTIIQGNGNDIVTIMVYMCGTDLESKYGMASADLAEMQKAVIGSNINLIVETGGCQQWKTTGISNTSNQIYQMTDKGLKLLDGNIGKKSMTDPATLSSFIQYCSSNYPADRYELILWDHGGGSISGYGYDQLFPSGSMTLDEIDLALKNGGCTFDFVGFDACLMATLENALMLEPYADYLIASEETEPGCGWYYTDWLTELSANPSMPTVEMGENIINDFIDTCNKASSSEQTTLSIIDLAKLDAVVPEALKEFSVNTTELLNSNEYTVVSNARSSAKEFASSSQINQVDLVDLATRMGTTEADNLVAAINQCVEYNRTSATISNANGVSIYFPYNQLGKLDTVLDTYDKIGMDKEYSTCIKSFANMAAGGQITTSGSGSPLTSLLGSLVSSAASSATSSSTSSSSSSTSSSGSSDLMLELLTSVLSNRSMGELPRELGEGTGNWIDEEQILSTAEYYSENRFDANSLVITEKGGQKVLALTEDQWSLIQEMEMNVFVDDGEGFIDLGLDNVYKYNEEGDLLMEYDGTWLALNGQVVSYYMVSDDRNGDSYMILGRIPAMLNDQLVDIVVAFSNENPNGEVLGAKINYNGVTDTLAKGLIEIQDGDQIDFLCDYYTYEGDYSKTYYLGDTMTVDGDFTVSNVDIGDMDYQMTYRLTDIYDNQYWTPAVVSE